MTESLKPKDRLEAVAFFRAQVIGPLTARDLAHGELADELRTLSGKLFRPPWMSRSRTYSVATLERWYYRYKAHGLYGLQPQPRSDRGYAKALTEDQRQLIMQIAEQRPEVSVSVLVRTLVADGRLVEGQISEQSVRRLLAGHGLNRKARRLVCRENRRRWQAARPNGLWHADVCHGPPLMIDNKKTPLRIHAILDDASRYIVAIRAFSSEREVDMLELLVEALRRTEPPKVLYLDNGSTYRGEALQLACARMDIRVVHAKPYDPQARGKMERFWRTLRGGCLNHLGACNSLHDVQVRLLAFLDQHYHQVAHAGLLGKCPVQVYEAGESAREMVQDDDLCRALTVRTPRRVRGDCTLSIGGIDWETDAGFLAGKQVTVARTLFDPRMAPWIEEEGNEYKLVPVDPIANASRPRTSKKRVRRGVDAVPFDPTGVLVDRMMGNKGGVR